MAVFKPTTQKKDRPDCYKCIHFFITWEKGTPYGCRGHGFKAKQLPAIVVFSSSGTHCLLFSPKPVKK